MSNKAHQRLVVLYLYSGYTGRRCENGLTVCASNPCYNNGTCSAVVGSNAFTCTCTGLLYLYTISA